MFTRLAQILTISFLAIQAAPGQCLPTNVEIQEANKLFYQNSDKLVSYVDKKLKAGKDKAYWSHIQAQYNLRNASRDDIFSFQPARQAAMLEPTNDKYLVTWALTLAEMNKSEQAHEIVNKVLKRSSKDARAHGVQSLLLVSSGANNAFAEEEMKTAIKLDPKDPDVNYLAMLVFKKLLNEKEYAQAVRRWVQYNPQDVMAHDYLARYYFDVKEKEKGLAEGKITLQLNPNFGKARRYMIEMLHSMGRYKELIEYARPYLTEEKHDAIMDDSWTRRADAYRHFKQFNKAAHDYGQALICLSPKTPLNEFSQDIKHFRNHLRRRYFEIWIARCQMLSECGQSKQALSNINKMVLALPENPGARQARIEILEKMQNYEMALKDVDILITKDPDIAEWYKTKAKLLRKMNKPKEAAQTEKRMKDVIEFGSK